MRLSRFYIQRQAYCLGEADLEGAAYCHAPYVLYRRKRGAIPAYAVLKRA